MFNLKRAGAVAGAAALTAGLSLIAIPAQAAPPANQAPTAANGWTEIKRTVDGGGVEYVISVDWDNKYIYQGRTRVAINPLVIYRSDANVLAHGSPEDAGLDLHFDVYSTNSQMQHRLYDAVDLDAAADNQASFNPANPLSNADDPEDADDTYSYIRVSAGTDGDGFKRSPFVIFRQPAGIPTNAA